MKYEELTKGLAAQLWQRWANGCLVYPGQKLKSCLLSGPCMTLIGALHIWIATDVHELFSSLCLPPPPIIQPSHTQHRDEGPGLGSLTL